VLLAARVNPLVAFGAIGVVGVCYGPAKYGILAELVPEVDLVLANAWIEVVTVGAVLGGAALGAALLNAPVWAAGLHTAAHQASLLLASFFAIAALWATAIPATACRNAPDVGVVAPFARQLETLWRDTQGQISLAVTALFWAVAAVLQFLVIRWAEEVLHLSLGEAALLQCCLAIGVIAGSLGVVRFVAANSASRVLPGGAALGLAIVVISQVTQLWTACLALCATGILAGGVMVPMNALLQQRGSAVMRPGASIAVQGFSENLASLVFLAVYSMLLTLGMPVRVIIVSFGLLVTVLMLLIRYRSRPDPRYAA